MLQLDDHHPTVEKFACGIKRFIYGLSKKVILANFLAETADRMFAYQVEDMGTIGVWVAIISYTLQIYYDFSGYSDMAIGLGKMFGFEFLENFDYPYVSKSITEFWKRWHISLSTWFKQYLYIPLGGNRKSSTRTYINLFIVFLATGLWHGASWNFVVWGLYHGVWMVIERMGFSKLLEKNPIKILNHIYTLVVVCLGWVFFRAESLSYALQFIKKMFVYTADASYINPLIPFHPHGLMVFFFALLCCGIVQKREPLRVRLYQAKMSVAESFGLIVLLLISVTTIVNGTYNPFIYFRF